MPPEEDLLPPEENSLPPEDGSQRTVRPGQECTDVYDFLEQVRLRPGMWLPPHGSLHHLSSMLVGYQTALDVHAVDEPFPFWGDGPFSQWLCQHFGRPSSLGWATQIEQETPDGSTPVEEFFRLLDDYRRHAAEAEQASTSRSEPTATEPERVKSARRP
jgi:hypothetical protein